MKKYLIIIAIGPVQEFIASARKLRDLWQGSYLLSELSKTVALSLYNDKADLIFPAISTPDDLKEDSPLIVANKIYAEITCDDPSIVIQNARTAWKAFIEKQAYKALAKMKEIKNLKINEELFKKQVGDYGEFYSVYCEFTGEYISLKAELEQLLFARKRAKFFETPQWDGWGIPKNSLDGLREAVTGDNQTEIQGLLKKNERLDAMGCIKRFAPLAEKKKGNYFDSLADIALTPWLNKVEGNTEYFLKLKEFESSIKSNPGITKSYRNNPSRPASCCLQIQPDFFYSLQGEIDPTSFQLLKTLISKQYAGEPGKYAVVLVGDGDKIGDALNQMSSPEDHRKFAHRLSLFAKNIRKEIEQQGGSLVYAGGDDVMAYVPLDHCIECADMIRIQFRESMTSLFQELDIDSIPTFSIGMTIVHHSEPLNNALNLARKAEQTAKEEGGRNALAIIQNKRSGNERTAYGSWDGDSLPERISAMINLFHKDLLPATLAHQLRNARVQAGDFLEYQKDDLSLIPLNASSALVLNLFNQKEHTEALIPVLFSQKSIDRLSEELIIAQQIAASQQMTRQGAVKCTTE